MTPRDIILFHEATGTGTIAEALAPGEKFKLLYFDLHIGAGTLASENLTVTKDAGAGGAYDTVLHDENLSLGTVRDIYARQDMELQADDVVDVDYNNGNGLTWGLTIAYQLI